MTRKAYLTDGLHSANLTEGGTDEITPSTSSQPQETEGVPALVILWSAQEPHRVGEVFLPPKGARPGIIGRGSSIGKTGLEKCQPLRQVPGANLPTPPLVARRISREQLRVSALSKGRVSVENLGRLPMKVGGELQQQVTLSPGQSLLVQDQLLLLCTQRPNIIPGESASDLHPLGGPDPLGMVGESQKMWQLRSLIHFIAPRPGHVLILGKSGAGKELVARAIHSLSPRGARPLVSRNAATIPDGLMDAELFGHAQGYPNSGMAERRGLVGDGDGSSLFLDEIGELALGLQAHLLRLMDEGEYQRLGDGAVRRADIRVIAATNRPIDALKDDFAARFRHVITVPDLDGRREDIPLLLNHLFQAAAKADPALKAQFSDESGAPRFSADLISALHRHPLPLQIRQLDNFLWQALAFSQGSRVECPPALGLSVQAEKTQAPVTSPEDISPEALLECLNKHGWVQSKVWRELGLGSRYVLRRLIKKHGLRDDSP